MCGIIAVLQRRSRRAVPGASEVRSFVDRAEAALGEVVTVDDLESLGRVADALAGLDALLSGPTGTAALVDEPSLAPAVRSGLDRLAARLAELDALLDATADGRPANELEAISAALIAIKDPLWAVGNDRLPTAAEVVDLGGPHLSHGAMASYWAVAVSLSAIDRLEVRGRDSAGLHITVHGHGLDLDDPGLATLLAERRGGPRFGHGAVEVAGGSLSFVYKAAAEIGELGDNTAVIRTAIRNDALLREAVSAEQAEVTVLGHTRWASVGIISEANTHPLNQVELGDERRPYVVAALNGDVDNYADLKVAHRLELPGDVTTDAKVIPSLVARALDEGVDATEAFRRTVDAFEGSVAIAADVAGDRDALHLALRGSGQGLFVGLGEDVFIVASEPYGVVEVAGEYLRLDGDTLADPDRPETRGQVVVLDRHAAGELGGIQRLAFDGSALPIEADELVTPEITTRDIDRGVAPHYLLKELTEAPESFRRTIRGRVERTDRGARAVLDDTIVPDDVRTRLADGSIRRVTVIGQGTAAIAGQSLAQLLTVLASDTQLDSEAIPATELSGFGLADDMSSTLVVAISQSGTTTDTNRTVDLVRSRGASVIAIVNRRGSDLVDRADGVLYTSDGRDVEMSVASTKAFYSQVAAGALLAFALAEAAGADMARHDELIEGLRDLPEAMRRVIDQRPSIREVAVRHAPMHRYWALVGNGANRIAANEVRIKLSELCYKAIPADATEDKKHIDLSSEPMILVCAAGLYGSTADDVAKEVAIFRAHKAVPIVIASEGEERFAAAAELVTVPAIHPELDFVLAAMVGHLFGYEAALAIDESARPLRELRVDVETRLAQGERADILLDGLTPSAERHGTEFLDGLRSHRYDGHLTPSTAVRLATVLRYASGLLPIEAYQVDTGRVGRPATVIEDLTAALSAAIDELTRPVDAIKHQAKTVTVGISRSDETLLQAPLVKAAIEAGTPRDRLTYATLRTLVGLDDAVAEVVGWTRYRIEGEATAESSLIEVLDRGGIARDIPSRTADNPALRGTKRRAAVERKVWVAVGGSDGRHVIHVPEVKGAQTTGLTLLHVRFHERLPAPDMRSVLRSFKDRYGALRDAVTETEPTFRDDVLGRVAVVELLTRPVYELAQHWADGSGRSAP
ncbi:MAG: SIS domain-containing protein [Actinomycetota bacterium]